MSSDIKTAIKNRIFSSDFIVAVIILLILNIFGVSFKVINDKLDDLVINQMQAFFPAPPGGISRLPNPLPGNTTITANWDKCSEVKATLNQSSCASGYSNSATVYCDTLTNTSTQLTGSGCYNQTYWNTKAMEACGCEVSIDFLRHDRFNGRDPGGESNGNYAYIKRPQNLCSTFPNNASVLCPLGWNCSELPNNEGIRYESQGPYESSVPLIITQMNKCKCQADSTGQFPDFATCQEQAHGFQLDRPQEAGYYFTCRWDADSCEGPFPPNP